MGFPQLVLSRRRMRPLSRRYAARLILILGAVATLAAIAPAQTSAPSASKPAWILKLGGEIRWQQVTPAGALLVSTDSALSGVDIYGGQIAWQKSELAGIPAESVHPVEGSLLMQAENPGLLLIF